MKKTITRLLALVLCVILVGSISAYAITPSFAPYDGYEYNTYKESIAAPIGYLPTDNIIGEDFEFQIEIQEFTDIALDDHSFDYMSFFILDGKTGAVFKTDSSLNVKCVFNDFTDKDGKKISLKGATQIACDYANSYFYVYKSNKIYIIDSNSVVVKSINVSNVVSLTTYSYQADVLNEVYDAYLCVVTSNKPGTILVYDANGEYCGSQKVGKNIVDIDASCNTNIVAVDKEASDSILEIMPFDISTGELEVASAYPAEVNANKIKSVILGEFGMGYYYNYGNKISYHDGSMLMNTTADEYAENFSFIAFDQNGRNVYGFSNVGKPHVSVFNSACGYVSSIEKLSVSLNEPSDMQYVKTADGHEYIYILDSGNSRILKVDKNLKEIIHIFANFNHSKTGSFSFYGAQGMAIDEKENIYIADTENGRVFRSDKNGNVSLIITRPDEQLSDTDAPFQATKILIDRKNLIYVICETINLGAFVFDQEGNFKNFFASNNVTATVDVLLNFFRKKFLTREQMKAIRKSTPITLTNFDVDEDGFIYTVTKTDSQRVNSNFEEMVRKLNYQGDNVFTLNENSAGFGDYEWDRQLKITNTSFSDVDVDDDGYMNLIDEGRNKIFQYTDEGNLVTVFGGRSISKEEQLGRFSDPVAIESVGEKIYVLDSMENSITVFEPTDYTKALRTAYASLDSSDAEQALKNWEIVRKFNTNSQYPYYGMGRAYEMMSDYENAMKYFELANAKNEYSKAYKEYRSAYISENIGIIVIVLLLIIVVAFFAIRFIKKKMVAKHGEAYSPLETKKGLPIYVLLHPVDGFEQFRTRNMHSVPIAIGLVIAFFLVRVFEFFATSFAFNQNRPIDYDMFGTIVSTIGLYLLFIIANWAVCTLANGKGRMKEIICVTAYALIPMMITTLISVGLSHFMALDEAAFVSMISVLGILWSAIILIMGLYTIHQYSFGGTIGSIILTIFGMAVLGLLIVLFFTLLQQCYSFFVSVYTELKLR